MTVRGKTGLQVLAERGIPEGALTGLLGVLSVMTVAIYIGGVQLGSNITVPDIVSPSQFWIVTVVVPILWFALCSRCFETPVSARKAWLLKIVALEALVILGSWFVAPCDVTHIWKGELPSAKDSKPFVFTLPDSPPVHDVEFSLESVKPERQLKAWIEVNQPTPGRNYEPQMAVGTPYVLQAGSGKASIRLFNFDSNPSLEFTLKASYVARRYQK